MRSRNEALLALGPTAGWCAAAGVPQRDMQHAGCRAACRLHLPLACFRLSHCTALQSYCSAVASMLSKSLGKHLRRRDGRGCNIDAV